MSGFDVTSEVLLAQAKGQPIVLLDTTMLAYGLPYPASTAAALDLRARVAAKGVLPVFAALIAGRVVVGVSESELHVLGRSVRLAKIGPADMAIASVRKATGVFTVGATLVVARRSGLDVLGTGGIGGVHRGLPDVMDVSPDLTELSRSAVAVVCSGAKAILDLPNTVEVLETLGIPVLGFAGDTLPGYWTRETGLPVTARVADAREVAAIWRAHRQLQLVQGVLVANPIAADISIAPDVLDAWIKEAEAIARERGIRGKALTPFLQRQLQEVSGGETLAATLQMVIGNALVAADISLAMTSPTE